MYAGRLNEKIEVIRHTTVKNDYGEDTSYSYTSAYYRAGTSHQSTSRSLINNEIQYPYQKQFTVRIYADIEEDDEIKYRNTYYLIESIEENREMQNKLITVSQKPV